MNFVYFTEKFNTDIKGTPHEKIFYARIKELEKYPDPSALNSVDAYRRDKVIVYKLPKTYNSRVIILIEKFEVEGKDASEVGFESFLNTIEKVQPLTFQTLLNRKLEI